MKGCECPLGALHGQSMLHLVILLDIIVIVEVKEIIVPHAVISKDGNHRKDHAHGCNLPGLMG